jgi:hypothetical protein
VEGRAATGKSRPPPAEHVALAGLGRHLAKAPRLPGEKEIGEARLDEAKDQPELGDLGRIGGTIEGVGREARSAKGIAADERLGKLGQRRQLALGPRSMCGHCRR